MNCDSVLKLIPLYSYGELTPEEEDHLDQHLHGCAPCQREMDRQTSLRAALDQRQFEPPPKLLTECRADLLAAIQGGAPGLTRPAKSPWRLFLDALTDSFSGLARLRQPVAATGLIAIGFLAAKISGGGLLSTPATTAGLGGDVFASVRSIQPEPSGGVQISYDETRRRVISGRMEDKAIQSLLLAAVQEENPAVRVESVQLLMRRAGSEGVVRDALMSSLAHDPNTGVRLKALEGLKPLAGDVQVRKTLAQVLMADDSPAVRNMAVDVLVAHRDDTLVRILQGLVQREENNSVRLKVEKALKDMNASIGTF